MGQLYAYLLLCSTLVLAAYADVSLYPTDETEASCGEKTTIECTATATNSVTITAKNDSFVFGVHTYERGSAREAKAGTLDLYLAQASVSAENPFLTNFRVIASENYMGKVTIMSCADVNAVQLVKIRTKPTQCRLPMYN
ncbi:hypothetical protein GBAR_LOCUS19043 [Geodia barretti]|uniref:Uncharacterized protein n=1 Tax=Geodia barretti TaxID=519541 RepID=A0AA35SQD4_GEOBA|nr:hypothetical protein GBAR_LOCUS19043 [Geodia barretti]